jgi:hypothetical protein
MVVVVPGISPSGNLTEPLSLSLKNFVQTNWPTSGVLVTGSQIKFRNLWWDGYGSYQIHFLDRNVPRRPQTLGWNWEQASDFVDCHIFVRKNTRVRPLELDDMKRSLETIIFLNRTNVPIIGPNNAWMHVLRTTDVPVADAVTDVWHAVVQVEIGYWLASTT